MIKGHEKLYWIWAAMVGRCTNPNNPAFKNYGGRGIGVAEAWRDPYKFISDMHPRPEGSTLERVDNNAGYSKENCIWASRIDNNLNKRTYANSPCGVSGITTLNGRFRVRIRRGGKIIFDKTVSDFFEACCLAQSNSKDKIK